MNHDPSPHELAAMQVSFADAWRQLGARHVPRFAEVLERYAEPARAYHTVEHVLACLRWLAVSEDLAERPLEVRLALIYHDVVYVPGRVDNEERSAALFGVHAQASRLPTGPADRIARMIVGTALHRADDGDEALVNDIDLAVLGSSPHGFARYEAAIREEYAHVDPALFRAGRERVLRSFVEATSIYRTSFFSRRLEAQARTNLAHALRSLQGRDAGGASS
ncbi:MAG: hypothetical protein KC543_03405 [Myxococcales bacterium]|nr:hypothetical protein [Myxococcales bacterium]